MRTDSRRWRWWVGGLAALLLAAWLWSNRLEDAREPEPEVEPVVEASVTPSRRGAEVAAPRDVAPDAAEALTPPPSDAGTVDTLSPVSRTFTFVLSPGNKRPGSSSSSAPRGKTPMRSGCAWRSSRPGGRSDAASC